MNINKYKIRVDNLIFIQRQRNSIGTDYTLYLFYIPLIYDLQFCIGVFEISQQMGKNFLI